MSTKKLGFGLMRLPLTNPDEASSIDVEQVKDMVDAFIENGFTYFDTAWMYCGFQSECAAKEALVLRKTGVEYFDYYLLHDIGVDHYKIYQELDCFTWLKEKKEQGLVRHIGFSFHDSAKMLDQVLTEHPEVEFVQLQLNYLDWDSEGVQSRKCYETAVKHGKPVIVMEPVKGGTLAKVPERAERMFKEYHPDMSVPSWAIRFAANLEGVITVLSGMSNVAQMEDNLSFMKDFNGLTDSEKETLDKAREAMSKIPLIPCTTCNYCAKVCPMEIGISGSFTAMNYLTLYGNKAAAAHQEDWLVVSHGRKRADECVKCGQCEEVCPQHISIREELEKVSEAFCK